MIKVYGNFKIEGDGTFGMKVIKPIGKGSVPKELRGHYSNALQAERAINQHLAGKSKET